MVLQGEVWWEAEMERDVTLHARVVEVVRGAWFCSNEHCVLHVRLGDPHVRGSGEWAVRPDGVVTSRRKVGDRILCDICGQKGGEFSTGGRT